MDDKVDDVMDLMGAASYEVVQKFCTGCEESKPLEDFHNDKHSPDGKTRKCKVCNNTNALAYHYENRETILPKKREYEKGRRRKGTANKHRRTPARVEAQRIWRSLHAASVAAYGAIRRARKMNAGIVEPVNRLHVANRDGWICQLCGKPIDPEAPYKLSDGSFNPEYLHIDHIVPLAQGGTHCYENCQAAHAKCNLEKSWRGNV